MISQEDNKLIDIKFIDNRDMTCANIYIFKKNWRMRILAGKFATFEQMLLTEKITKYAYYKRS